MKKITPTLQALAKRMLSAGAESVSDRGLRLSGVSSAANGLIYARGFLLTCDRQVPVLASGWNQWDVGGWHLRVDPRVPVDHAVVGTRELWIIGDAFHPAAGVFSQLAKWILKGDLEQALDGLAGRFALIFKDGARVEVYHDALGARSVFYGKGVVASHASLAAEVTKTGLREWIIPFITSRAYLKRDVKYLPGLESPYDGVLQLTPNCKLSVGDMRVERYWPRSSKEESPPEKAMELLIGHLEGLGSYFRENQHRPVMGLTGGTDSRGVFAALKDMAPTVFTIVRSRDGHSERSADSQAARALVALMDLELHIVKATAPAPLDAASSDFATAFRWNTGQVRGVNAGWLEQCAEIGASEQLFVRGFGGEVMRGFYRHVEDFDPGSLGRLYDVNAGSQMTVGAFERFMEVSEWSRLQDTGYRPDEMLYWEHRMGIWGASALSEADMVFRCLPGYNSRQLYSAFMGLHPKIDRRGVCHEAISRLAPALNNVPFAV